MISSVFASVIAYISTNIDDIFAVMILLALASKRTKNRLVAGHFLGVAAVTLISMLGAFGLQGRNVKLVGLLGLVPIGLGIKAWMDHKNGVEDEALLEADGLTLLGMASITVGNGGDNVGVYVPLFMGFSGQECVVAWAVFAVMTLLCVILANALAEFPKIREHVETKKHIVIPVVFLILGVYIILDSGLLG